MAKRNWMAVVAAVAVTGSLMKAEEKSDGAIAEGTEEVRNDVVFPLLDGLVGGLGDAVLVVRDEAQRQGLNPGAVLSGPTVYDQPDMNPRDVAELPPLAGEEQGGN